MADRKIKQMKGHEITVENPFVPLTAENITAVVQPAGGS